MSHSTHVSKHGRISVTMRLYDNRTNPDVGRVRIEGKFRTHGRFTGEVVTRTDSHSCNATFPFTIHAR